MVGGFYEQQRPERFMEQNFGRQSFGRHQYRWRQSLATPQPRASPTHRPLPPRIRNPHAAKKQKVKPPTTLTKNRTDKKVLEGHLTLHATVNNRYARFLLRSSLSVMHSLQSLLQTTLTIPRLTQPGWVGAILPATSLSRPQELRSYRMEGVGSLRLLAAIVGEGW